MNIKKAKEFDLKARQTKILNRLTELSDSEKKRIDDQVMQRAMANAIGTTTSFLNRKTTPREQRLTFWQAVGWVAVGFATMLIIIELCAITL